MMSQCTEEAEFREKEIADANDANGRATASRTKCADSLRETQEDLPDLKAALQTYEDELVRVTEQRAKEHAAYLVRKADYAQAIEFLQGFLAELEDKMSNFSAFSFAQKAQYVLKHANKLGLMKEAVPVLLALASKQIPAHNDYTPVQNEDVATQLKNAVTSLLQRIEADNQENERIEAVAVEAFNKLKATLEANIQSLKDNIAKAEEQIELMQNCIDEEDKIIQEAQAKLARNTQLRDSASEMCDTFAKEFVEATKARLDEIKTVQEIIQICAKRFGQLPEDLVGYLTTVENGFAAYVNSTAFQKFVEYAQQHIADNKHGRTLGQENHVTGTEETPQDRKSVV